jgi:hypothetical protein
MSDGIVVSGGSVEEIGNRFEGSWCSGSLSSCEAPVFKPPLKGSGGDDESSVGEPVGQLLMGIALGKVELLELISEALQIDRGRHKAVANLQY